MREGEALALECVDLTHGLVRLDENEAPDADPRRT
jgi:hypothetical protein